MGKTYSFKCITRGNPLPKIEWAFKNCSEYGECESKTQTPVNLLNMLICINYYFILNMIYTDIQVYK